MNHQTQSTTSPSAAPNGRTTRHRTRSEPPGGQSAPPASPEGGRGKPPTKPSPSGNGNPREASASQVVLEGSADSRADRVLTLSDGQEVALSPTQFLILAILFSHALKCGGCRDDLPFRTPDTPRMAAIDILEAGQSYLDRFKPRVPILLGNANNRTISKSINRIRKHLKDAGQDRKWIASARGVTGYRLTLNPSKIKLILTSPDGTGRQEYSLEPERQTTGRE